MSAWKQIVGMWIGTALRLSWALKQCDFEQSGYFIIITAQTYNDAAYSCVSEGAELAHFIPQLSPFINVCSEWDMNVYEPWVARRPGDIDCPSVKLDDDEHVVGTGSCLEARPALCWRYPIARETVTAVRVTTQTVTDYRPSIVSMLTITELVGHHSVQSTTTVERLVHRGRRVARNVPEWILHGPTVTFNTTIVETVTVVKQVPASTAIDTEYVVAVHHATTWSTEYTLTTTETLSINC